MTELPEPGLEVAWSKDSVPLSLSEGRYQTVNRDCSYQLVIADVTTADQGIYTVQGGGYETSVPLCVVGEQRLHFLLWRHFCAQYGFL